MPPTPRASVVGDGPYARICRQGLCSLSRWVSLLPGAFTPRFAPPGWPGCRSKAVGEYGASVRRDGRIRWSAGRKCPCEALAGRLAKRRLSAMWNSAWACASRRPPPPAAAQRADGPAPSRLDSDRMQSAEPRIYARANGRPAARHHRHSGGAPFHRGPGLSAPLRSLLGFRV
jgi:hypothetical protein